jgi:adenosylmethionine-8-amino-7-oxononanoate aminotransferase
MARGLMVYPMGGTIDGRNGDHVLLAPPFIVNAAQVDEIVGRLGEAVEAALQSLPPFRGKVDARSAAG